MRAGEIVEIFMPVGSSVGGLLTWETISRNISPSHTYRWANKLQGSLPGRMNLAVYMIVNQGALDWDGAGNCRALHTLCKAEGKVSRRNKEWG